jgi:hypothetical protein
MRRPRRATLSPRSLASRGSRLPAGSGATSRKWSRPSTSWSASFVPPPPWPPSSKLPAAPPSSKPARSSPDVWPGRRGAPSGRSTPGRAHFRCLRSTQRIPRPL